MNHEIYVREAVTETETAAFWTQLYAYFLQDILPGSTEADRAYFLGAEYRKQIQTLHDRPQDALRYLFFSRDGQNIGFSMVSIYTTEDGKCLVLEFCVFPEFLGSGTG